MATKYSIRTSHKYNTFEPIALFSDCVPSDALIGFCDAYLDIIEDCTGVELIDLETGEVVYGIYADDDPDAWDNDCCFDAWDNGFDPYLGCYTDDC